MHSLSSENLCFEVDESCCQHMLTYYAQYQFLDPTFVLFGLNLPIFEVPPGTLLMSCGMPLDKIW